MKTINIKNIATVCLAVLLSASGIKAQQQSYTPVSQYFQNGYLWNPAYAGSKEHTSVYALINNSWIGFDGAPVLAMVSVDMPFGNFSGAGFRFISDKSGLLQRTSGNVDYSFTVKMNEDQRLRLGITGSVYKEQLNTSAYINGVYDPAVASFAQKGWQFESNFGAVYEHKKFSAGVAVYNLIHNLQKGGSGQSDYAVANFMVSNKFVLANKDMSIKPMVSYRVYSNVEGLLDIGAQFEYDHIFHASLIWRNNSSIGGGLGVILKNVGQLNAYYFSNNKYGYGQQYEIGLGIPVGKSAPKK